MLYRYTYWYTLAKYGPDYEMHLGDISQFSDAAQVSSWAESGVKWAVGNDIMNGMSSTTLLPGGTATRVQMAKMLTILFRDHLKMIENGTGDVHVTVYVHGITRDGSSLYFGTAQTVDNVTILPGEQKRFPVERGEDFVLQLTGNPMTDIYDRLFGFVDYVKIGSETIYYGQEYTDVELRIPSVNANKEVHVYFTLSDFYRVNYAFSNSRSAFGYPGSYEIPLEAYTRMYPDRIAERMYDEGRVKGWGGYCYGMASTTMLMSQSERSDIKASSFARNNVRPNDVKLSDASTAVDFPGAQKYSTSLEEWIASMHVSQKDVAIVAASDSTKIESNKVSANIDTLFTLVDTYEKTGKNPILIAFDRGSAGHAIVPYALEYPDATTVLIKVYDTNRPGDKKDQHLKFIKNGDGKYVLDAAWWADEEPIKAIYYLSLNDVLGSWENRGNLTEWNATTYSLATSSSDNFSIVNDVGSEMKLVDGEICDGAQFEGYVIWDIGNPSFGGEEVPKTTMLWLPEGSYTFTPSPGVTEPVEVSLSGNISSVAAVIEPDAAITVGLDNHDVENLYATIHGATGDDYSITFGYSQDSGAEFEEFTVSGTMQEEELMARKCVEGVEIAGADNIDAERVDFNQTVIQNPGIIPIAETVILDGKTAQVVSGAITQLNVPTNLQFDTNGLASWDAVANAEKYQIRLYLDGEATGPWVDVTLPDTEHSFEDDMTEAGGYTYAVQAVGDGSTHASSPIALYSEPKQLLIALDSPENLVFIRGSATWDAVEYATGYQVQLYKEGEKIGTWAVCNDNAYYFGELMTDSMAEYTFSVIAIGDGIIYKNSKASVLAEGSNLLPQLAVPQHVNFRQGIASWAAVENASDYYLTLYCSGEVVKIVRTLDLTVDFNSYIVEYGIYYYEIRAVGDDILFANSPVVTSAKYYHTPPSTSQGTSSYEIKVTQNEGGQISPDTGKHQAGTNVMFTITPNNGYQVQAVLVDGISVGAVSTYTFNDVQKSHTITAQFVMTTTGTGIPFVDVTSGDWHYDAVKFVYENAIMNGTDRTHFAPDMVTTRGMLVTVLYRMANSPSVESTYAFQDVAANTYYSSAVSWASSHGIVTGYDNQSFGPEDSITREQLAAILSRYAAYLGQNVTPTTEDTPFADDAMISDYAKTAVLWAVEANLLRAGLLPPCVRRIPQLAQKWPLYL